MLKERVITALVLAPLVIAGMLWLSTSTLAACIGVIMLIGVLEWATLIGFTVRAERMALVVAHVFIMGLLWQFRAESTLLIATWVGVAWWLVAPLWLAKFEFGQQPTRGNTWIKALAGLLAVVPAWAAMILLHGETIRGELPSFANHIIVRGGPLRDHWWLLFVVVLIWCADISAYTAGRRYGTVKLAPRISPGKTMAGVYGALIGCAIFAAGVGWLLNVEGVSLLILVALSLITVAISIVGDLFESLIKRHSNSKDSGTLFPGHGGVFDRLDSLFAALPVFTAGKLLLGL